MSHLERRFNRLRIKVAREMGEAFNLYRPNYSQVSGTPVLIKSNLMVRMEPNGERFSETGAKAGIYFEVFTDVDLLQPGDILKPVESNAPAVTIVHFHPMKPIVALRTNRVGKLTKGLNTNIFTDIYFDFQSDDFPGNALNEKLLGSLGVPLKRAMFYSRSGIEKGMQLIETDNFKAFRWQITAVRDHNSVVVVTLEEDNT